MQKLINIFAIFSPLLLAPDAQGAVDQFLNDNFFQNPAELSMVRQMQLIVGNTFINPAIQFEGKSFGAIGSAKSKVNDYLPYLLSDYRMTERWVLGLNVTPSAYGHLDWPSDSIVSSASTLTDLLYYRIGAQSSYQLTDKLAIGLGFNIEDNALYQLNFIIPGKGNQVNSITGLNYTGDVGVYYEINSKNYLTLAGYTQVNTYGYGTSSIGLTRTNNLSLNITQAPVIYLGLKHFATDNWFVSGKIYWSGWSIQQYINFTNTTTGTYDVPTTWKDVWSFQLSTRYATTEKIGILGSIIYETNPVPLATNAIGYPLAASGAISVGLDLTMIKNLSAQVLYSYGKFLPNSPINNTNSVGTVFAQFQAVVFQLTYKR